MVFGGATVSTGAGATGAPPLTVENFAMSSLPEIFIINFFIFQNPRSWCSTRRIVPRGTFHPEKFAVSSHI